MFYLQTRWYPRDTQFKLNILSHLNFDFEKICMWLWLLFTCDIESVQSRLELLASSGLPETYMKT